MGILKDIGGAPAFQNAAGTAIAYYLKFVAATSRHITDPPDLHERIAGDLPVIFAMWHGEHFMMPFANGGRYPTDAMVSRHRDGGINAAALRCFNIRPIRGSGAVGNDFHRKGGVPAFRALLQALEEGRNVALTADVPKISRIAGSGIVRLAAHSGRPIITGAIVTSRRRHLDTWDRSVVNLPFGRMVVTGGDPIYVSANADDEEIEQKRKAVENGLNEAHERAYAIADGRTARSDEG